LNKLLNILLLLFAVIAIFPSIGCSNNQVAVKVGLGEAFTIGVGESARIAGEDMTITFFNDYTLTYSLNPYPREGEEISPNDYRLTLTLTK